MFSTSTIFFKNNQKLFSKKEFTQSVEKKVYKLPVFAGKKQKIVRMLIWINILAVSLKTFGNPFVAISGSDAAAAIVGIGGTGLVIFLLVLAIKAITAKKRKPD